MTARRVPLDEQIAKAQTAKEAIAHALHCPDDDIATCPNVTDVIAARLDGQPLEEAHPHRSPHESRGGETRRDGAGANSGLWRVRGWVMLRLRSLETMLPRCRSGGLGTAVPAQGGQHPVPISGGAVVWFTAGLVVDSLVAAGTCECRAWAHWSGWRAMEGGSRPASSQPARVASRGRPTAVTVRSKTGTRLRLARSLRYPAVRAR